MPAEFQPDDELLSAYLDGELSAEELREVEAWIERDPAARAMVDELRSVAQMVQSLPVHRVPPDWSASLAARLDQAPPAATAAQQHQPADLSRAEDSMPSIPIGRTRRGWWWSAAAIAAAVAIVAWSNLAENEQAGDVALKPRAGAGELRAVPETRGRAADGIADVSADDAGELATDDAPVEEHEEHSAPLLAEDDALGMRRDRESADLLAAAPPAPMATAMPIPLAAPFSAAEPHLIVWADVPPETLREQQITKLLASNGIRIEDAPPGATAATTRARQQIEMRNSLVNRAAGDPAASAIAEGLGGRAESSRFNVPDTTDGTTARSDNRSTELADGQEQLEGATLLVQATADQIAACLAEMQRDTDNFDAITVEPVQAPAVASGFGQLAAPPTADSPPSADEVLDQSSGTVEQMAEAQAQPTQTEAPQTLSGEVASAPQARQPSDFAGGAMQQAQSEAPPRAWKVAVPEAWYYSNSPPQDADAAYQVRSAVASKAQATSKSAISEEDKREQLANLNRFLSTQNLSGAAAMQQSQQVQQTQQTQQVPQAQQAQQMQQAQVLTEEQPMQVLFVLRNSHLPSPAAPRASETPPGAATPSAAEAEPTTEAAP